MRVGRFDAPSTSENVKDTVGYQHAHGTTAHDAVNTTGSPQPRPMGRWAHKERSQRHTCAETRPRGWPSCQRSSARRPGTRMKSAARRPVVRRGQPDPAQRGWRHEVMHHQMSGGVQLAPYIVSRLLVDSTSTSSCTAAPMGATRSPGAFGWLGSSAATFDATSSTSRRCTSRPSLGLRLVGSAPEIASRRAHLAAPASRLALMAQERVLWRIF